MLGQNLLNNAPLNSSATAASGTIPGALYLDIPSNYESRIAAIPAQNFPTGMPGAPNAYQYKQTNICRGYDGEPDQSGGTWSEPAEGRYCAQGQPCLRVELDGPAACTLTFTLDGYTYVHTDNHLTNQTRQTTYSYARTAFSYDYSLEYDPADDYGYVYLTLPDGAFDPDLEVVGRVTISGFVDGDWTVSEPYWTPDPDSTVAPKLKAFEGPVERYTEGGLSAAHDSVARTALCDANEANAGHDNTVETRTVRMFDYLEGAVSGLDLTTAHSLAAMASRISLISDAWTATVDATEYDNATLDDAASRLSAMYGFDICAAENEAVPLLQPIDNACNASIRCGQWSIASGILCAIRPDKVIGGMMHGIMHSGGELARGVQGESVWYREQGSGEDYAELCQPTADNAGHWRSVNGEVYADHDPVSVLREYGVGNSVWEVTSTDRWATRENDIAQLVATGLLWDPFLAVDAHGIAWRVAESGGVVYCHWFEPQASAPAWASVARPFGTTGEHWRPSICVLADGSILVAATHDGDTLFTRSRDQGTSWEAVALANIGDGLEYGAIDYRDGEVVVAGWDADKIKFRSSSEENLDADDLTPGVTTLDVCAAVVTGDAEKPRSCVLHIGGQVLVCVGDGGDMTTYRAWDYDTGFAVVA